MKKTLLLLVSVVLSVSTFAQLKYHSDGTLSTGPIADINGYSVHLYGYDQRFYQGNRYIGFQMVSGGSRIYGNDDRVVFYSRLSNRHNSIEVRSVYEASDRRLKTNILPVFNTLDKLKSLNAFSYNFIGTTPDPLLKSINAGADSKEIKDDVREVGFIAQDVEKLFPEFVREDTDGNKLINYRSFIPLLVESIKELSEQVADLQEELSTLKGINKKDPFSKSAFNDLDDASERKARLYQNTPNPANGITKIRYYVPENTNSANIVITNLQGFTALNQKISDFGEGEIEVNVGSMTSGLYLYVLVVDNQPIESKKMMVTN